MEKPSGWGKKNKHKDNGKDEDVTNESVTKGRNQLSASSSPRLTDSTVPLDEQTDKLIVRKKKHGWCSWCFKEGEHLKVSNGGPLGRKHWKCDNCLNKTVKCYSCKKGMAKGHIGRFDNEIRCAKCQGTIKDWGEVPDQETPGWCSWCLQHTKHRLLEKRFTILINRSQFECSYCQKHTTHCTTCSAAFSRSRVFLDDFRCGKCAHWFKDWENIDMTKVEREAWCSFCIEKTAHTLYSKHSMIGAKDDWQCSYCSSLTEICSTCHKSMARNSPINHWKHCVGCKKKKDWEELHTMKMNVFNAPFNIKTEMSKDSPFKQKCLKKGVIRPFLLLVAAGPRMRTQISNLLGYTLVTKKFFGDSHAEAHNILVGHKTNSFEDKCHEITSTIYNRLRSEEGMSAYTWYQILHLVATSAWKTVDFKKLSKKDSKECCSVSSSCALIRELENNVLSNIAREYLIKGNRQQTEVINGWWETRNQHANVLANLEKGGIPPESEAMKYAFTIYRASLEMNARNNACTIDVRAEVMVSLVCKAIALCLSPQLALVIGVLWTAYDILEYAFGRTEMTVVVPLVHLLNTRIILDANGVFIEDFY